MKAISDVSDCTKGKKDVIKQKHTSLLETMKNIGFDNLPNMLTKQPNNQTTKQPNNQTCFYRICMKLFESILLFICTNREQSLCLT